MGLLESGGLGLICQVPVILNNTEGDGECSFEEQTGEWT